MYNYVPFRIREAAAYLTERLIIHKKQAYEPV